MAPAAGLRFTVKQNKTMKKILIAAFCGLTLIALTGCGTLRNSVPIFALKVDMKTGQVSLQNPKDTTIKNYRTSIGTNGAVSVSFDSLSTVMNPEVITTTGDAQSKMIAATGKVVTDAISAVGTTAAQAAAAGLKP
jgi:uncharacterized lipoprotein YajG